MPYSIGRFLQFGKAPTAIQPLSQFVFVASQLRLAMPEKKPGDNHVSTYLEPN